MNKEISLQEADLQNVADAINDYCFKAVESAGKVETETCHAVLYAIRAGRELKAVKTSVGFGCWGDFVKNMISVSQVTCSSYMSIAGKYPEVKTIEDVKELGLTSMRQALRKAALEDNPRRVPVLRPGGQGLDDWEGSLNKFMGMFRKDVNTLDDWSPAKCEDVLSALSPILGYRRLISERLENSPL